MWEAVARRVTSMNITERERRERGERKERER